MGKSFKKRGRATEDPNEYVDRFGYRRLAEGKPRSKPVPIKNILPQILAKYGGARRLSVERFQENFKAILTDLFPGGEGDAGFYDGNSWRLVGFRSGVLQVRVANAPLQSEFAFYKGEILRRMQEAMPDDKIRDIRFTLITN